MSKRLKQVFSTLIPVSQSSCGQQFGTGTQTKKAPSPEAQLTRYDSATDIDPEMDVYDIMMRGVNDYPDQDD